MDFSLIYLSKDYGKERTSRYIDKEPLARLAVEPEPKVTKCGRGIGRLGGSDVASVRLLSVCLAFVSFFMMTGCLTSRRVMMELEAYHIGHIAQWYTGRMGKTPKVFWLYRTIPYGRHLMLASFAPCSLGETREHEW
jgi:hypothetical protein